MGELGLRERDGREETSPEPYYWDRDQLSREGGLDRQGKMDGNQPRTLLPVYWYTD